MLCSASNSYDGCIDPLKIEFNNSFRPAAWEKFPGHLDANWRTQNPDCYFGRWTFAFEPIFSSFCLTKNNGIKAKFSNKRDYFFKAGKIKKMERNEKYNWAWRWAKFLPTQLKRLVTTLHHQSNIDALKPNATQIDDLYYWRLMTHHEILVQLLDFAAVVVSLTEITAEKND